MTAVELATYCVPADLASPALAAGYNVACSAFYERGFGMPPHRFLYSLLQLYGLEVHQLTLCEAYMGIEPHFNLWNYFFRV
jgi:hypothetical protein